MKALISSCPIASDSRNPGSSHGPRVPVFAIFGHLGDDSAGVHVQRCPLDVPEHVLRQLGWARFEAMGPPDELLPDFRVELPPLGAVLARERRRDQHDFRSHALRHVVHGAKERHIIARARASLDVVENEEAFLQEQDADDRAHAHGQSESDARLLGYGFRKAFRYTFL